MVYDGPRRLLCLAFFADLASGPVRIAEGLELDWQGHRWSPEDALLGTVVDFDVPEDSVADQAPELGLTWAPPDVADAFLLTDPANQGRRAWLSILSLDHDTHAVLAERRIFTGLVDSAELTLDGGRGRMVRMGLATEIDRFLKTDKGNRLNHAFHQKVNPGEMGLSQMTGTIVESPWGVKGRPRRGGGGGGGGGNGGRGLQHR